MGIPVFIPLRYTSQGGCGQYSNNSSVDYMQSRYVGIFGDILGTHGLSMDFYSADILLNISLAHVTLSQLSSCLSKAAVTETSLLVWLQ